MGWAAEAALSGKGIKSLCELSYRKRCDIRACAREIVSKEIIYI